MILLFSNKYNLHRNKMFRTTRINTINSDSNRINADIMYYISINDFQEFKNIMSNKDNINRIIDNTEGYTPLHYAIYRGRDNMIKYLLDLGVSPDTKTLNGDDAYTLSVKYGNMYLINQRFDKDKIIISDSQKNVTTLQRKLNTSETNNKYLIKSNDELLTKNGLLKNEALILKKDINKLNNENLEIKSENNELRTLKRKYENLEKSFDGLLCNIKK